MPDRRQVHQAARARMTSRAAVLAVVICAIALSLAYPVREYIAQHRQISQLQAQHRVALAELHKWEHEQRHLSDPAYVERLARDKLHLCMPNETCYVVVGGSGSSGHTGRTARAATVPWYERLWHSVQQANRTGSA